MARLTFWMAGCRPSLVVWMLVLMGTAGLSAYGQELGTASASAVLAPVDPFLDMLTKLPWPAVLGILGWRGLALVERGLTIAESCWRSIHEDGVPRFVVRHHVVDKAERRRDPDATDEV